MLRILHIGFSQNPGGVENIVMNYYRYIDRRVFQFDFLDMYGKGIAFYQEIKDLGGKIYCLPNYKKHPISVAKELYILLNRTNYDFVHIHMQSAANLLPVLISVKHGKEVVICHAHSSSTPKGMLRKLFNALNINYLRKLPVIKWACGEHAGQWMWGNQFSRKNIIPNAIDYQKYKYDEKLRVKKRQECGFDDSDKVIGFVGRFGDEKNTFFLLDILHELNKKHKNYKLLTVGGNDLYSEFEKQVKDKKLSQFYFSAGIQQNTAEWYQAMDAFLLPSFFEGFPVVAVEAQISGVPCFLSDRIAREVAISSDIQFLPIEKGCEIGWAKEISDRLKNEKCSKQNLVSSQYDIRVAVKELELRYRKLHKMLTDRNEYNGRRK